MASIDIDRLIDAISANLNTDISLRQGLTVNITSVRRSGAGGDALVLTGTFIKDGQVYDLPSPIEWRGILASGNRNQVLSRVRDLLNELVP